MSFMGDFGYTLAWLVNMLLKVYFWIVCAAVLASWIPFTPYHPTARMFLRFLRSATEPVFDFFKRMLRFERYTTPLDLTPLFVILAIFFLRIFLVGTILAVSAQLVSYILSDFFFAVVYTLFSLLDLYFWIVLIAVIVSWIPLDPYHPITHVILTFLRKMTEPVFSFLRRTLRLQRYTSPLDFTPMIVLALIFLLQNMVLNPLLGLFYNPTLILFH